MTRIELHRLAKAELRSYGTRYERQSPGRGGRLIRAFEAVVRRIQANPFIFSVEYKNGIRLAQFQRFPFALPYLFDEDRIWVAAVAHQKRKPQYSGRRLKDR